MVVEIPQNEVRTKMVKIAGEATLFALLSKLHEDSNVIKIEHRKVGSMYEVTAHYAIMDLAIQLASVDCKIEKYADELQKTSYVNM